MRRLTTGIRSEKCVLSRFRQCANVIVSTYINLGSIAYCRGADMYLARPGRKQVTATEDFEFHISYL